MTDAVVISAASMNGLYARIVVLSIQVMIDANILLLHFSIHLLIHTFLQLLLKKYNFLMEKNEDWFVR